MPNYLRTHVPAGLFFFTVKVANKRPLFAHEVARHILHEAITEVRQDRPFLIEAIVLLPDHLHCIWQMPEADGDYSIRWGRIKRRFSQLYRERGLPLPPIGRSKYERHESGIFQRRFWEHLLRDDNDIKAHLDYIHYNPIEHGFAACAHAWPYSSFSKWVGKGEYTIDWLCTCDCRQPGKVLPAVENLEAGE